MFFCNTMKVMSLLFAFSFALFFFCSIAAQFFGGMVTTKTTFEICTRGDCANWSCFRPCAVVTGVQNTAEGSGFWEPKPWPKEERDGVLGGAGAEW